MRILFASLVLLRATWTIAQSTPLINEVCASNHGNLTDAEGRTPDWIELHNPGAKTIELMGWRIAINGKQQVIDSPLRIPTKGHLLLRCDGKPERGAEHLGFTLPRTGGAILLIAPDGTTIADLFTYPALPADASIGRMPDGARSWSWFAEPTPGGSNSADAAVRGRSRTPSIRISNADSPLLEIASVGTVHLTLDGSDPSGAHAIAYSGPITIERGSIVRAIAREAGRYDSEEAALLIPAQAEATNAISLALDPADLFGDSLGIYHPGAQQNHTRKGRVWEREALLLIGDDALPVGARIFGSGSRSLGKRSFKLIARDRYDSPTDGFVFNDGTHVHEGVLRADASPHAFLRNAVMEELVERFDLNVEVQPSTAHPLYLNGAYWGLYRWMPAKDTEWLKQRSTAEALDVLEGPAATERSGSDAHFLRAQRLLISGAPIDSIDAMIDTRSLIDLACIDLWTGRADHELNVRCYRPKEKGGRWRWVLFDMDLWAPPHENSVQRMGLATAPETPYVPQLIAHPVLQ
ncbi:MAG TPA: CotH kinase family protein, partial [Flavobacteriales bacterium]|nr:CotH kinase family protein [Flavobacteriales bacterium]